MSKKKKTKKIRQNVKERVILTDVLPFELPIIFSNRYFYEFLSSNKVRYDAGSVFWSTRDNPYQEQALENIVEVLFGILASNKKEKKVAFAFLNGARYQFSSFSKIEEKMPSIPFKFGITHGANQYRELTVCHPRNQLEVIGFYDKYKSTILYNCNRSPFSIRKPVSIGKSFIKNNIKVVKNSVQGAGRIEEIDKEYENPRSFFAYSNYSNIYKFFESPKFHHCEKKYDNLLKIDISKCFDSIYTHSIPWAVIGKANAKEQFLQWSSFLENTFANKFDKLMQRMNFNETNGIIIGPEFSRIFAEIILQSVDRDLLILLEKEKNGNLILGEDYEIFRYIDDYFVFFNEVKTKTTIYKNLQVLLKEYKLFLNSEKETLYSKPIVTEITIAKKRIVELVDKKVCYKLNPVVVSETNQVESEYRTGTIFIDGNKLITEFKIIIKDSGADYSDVLSYTLSLLERKFYRIQKDFKLIEPTFDANTQVKLAILNILEFAFFIYSASPRVNSTLRLVYLVYSIISFVKSNESFIEDMKHSVYFVINNNIRLLIRKNGSLEHTQVETLYLLLVLHELGDSYKLSEVVLREYFSIEIKDSQYSARNTLNYFSIIILLFYIGDDLRYIRLRQFIELHIVEKFEVSEVMLKNDTELTLLFFDSLTCPYISKDTKKQLLVKYTIEDEVKQDNIIEFREYWFTKWTNFDLASELEFKRGKEVY